VREKRAVTETLRAVAENEGWTIVGEFADRGDQSASKPRSEWRRLRSLVEAGEIDVVAIASLTAIGDVVSDLLVELLWLRDQRCDLYVHDVGLNTVSPVDRVLFKVVEAFKAVDDAAAPVTEVSRTRRGRAGARAPTLTQYQSAIVRAAISSGLSLGEVAKSLKLPVASVRAVAKDQDV
jgi:DNA invertase Pin-like site-specific DNA recombinase